MFFYNLAASPCLIVSMDSDYLDLGMKLFMIPLRIAFISEHYPPATGGVATSTARIARALKALGHTVEVYCFDNSSELTVESYILEENDSGVPIVRIGPFFLQRKSSESISEKYKALLRRAAFDTISQRLRQNAPDVIFGFYLLNAGFIAALLSEELGIPLVTSARGEDISRNIFQVDRFATVQWTLDRSSFVAVPNTHLGRRTALLCSPSKIKVIENSIALNDLAFDALETRRELLAETAWSPDSTIAVFIGRLRYKKGVSTLVRAIELSFQHGIRLLVVGPEPGPVEQVIVGDHWDKIRTAGAVHVTGYLPRGEVIAAASAGDVITLPSTDDGLANGILEGIAAGLCPIVSTVFDDVIENGVSGITVAPSDPNALAQAMISLHGKAKLRSKLAEAAYASRLRWQPLDEANAYAQLFVQAIDRRS